MSNTIKLIIVMLMTTALAAGFIAGVVDTSPYNPERLHVFLFNLCAGGTILIYHSERLEQVSLKALIFLSVSLCYALFAFFELYPAAIACSLILAVIVEYVRKKRYPLFPFDFFSSRASVAEKFNHAALLCLVIGLIISSLVIVNNSYLEIVSIAKLELDTFFLGFSFPLSLVTMSVMFSMMENGKSPLAINHIKNACFWTFNLGVIIFFGFILMDLIIPQVFVTITLLIAVVVLFILFLKSVKKVQEKTFLVSGMMFLVYTSVTGIFYIVLHFYPAVYERSSDLLIRLHSFSSLYGWNLSGLAVICRFRDFPIRLHSGMVITLHWLIVALLAPLGYYNSKWAGIATGAYFIFLLIVFFSKETNTKGAELSSLS